MTSDVKLLPCPFCKDPMQNHLGIIRHVDQGRCPIGAYAWPVEEAERWNTHACIEADRKSMTGRAIGTVVELDGRHSFIPIDHAFITPVGAKQTLVYTHPAPDGVARLVEVAGAIAVHQGGSTESEWERLHEALAPFTTTQQEADHD